MKIYALSVVKNEFDIIEANLKAASKWANKIFVLDNGSTDGTWEKVQSLASDIIVPWKQDSQPFRDHMRSQLFREFGSIAVPGDWWCIRLDADEFYYDDPREFLAAVPVGYQYVCGGFVQFQLTKKDVQDYTFTGHFEQDRNYIRHFIKGLWVEVRFVRHRQRLTWPKESPFPRHMGIVYPKVIITLHYQYRSPAQIQLRLNVRHAAKAAGHHSPHVTQNTWEEVLLPRENLYSLDDNVKFGDLLPENKYLQSKYIVYIKRLLRGIGLLP